MLTVEALKNFGADTAEGLARCMGNEAFYLRLVGMIARDGHMDQLREALAAHDPRAGFEAAHALKGVLANLALTPVLEPVSAITELLRGGTDADCSALMAEADEQMSRLLALIAS